MAYLEQFWSNFRLADLFDILVVAALIYVALSWIRHRTSVAVSIGFFLVGAIYYMARELDMYLTSLVFQLGFTVILIGLVVVYQKEVRRGLDRLLSTTRFGARTPKVESVLFVDTLTEALGLLARERVGALVVLRGRESIESHVRGGIPLGGRVSLPLLHSIFHPATQGHDGAVLIEKDRVTRFAVHLPLSHDLAAVKGRGTRHTAALGLAERCDALILVVSEERGRVSIARDGQLFEVESTVELHSHLESFWREHNSPQRKSWWRRLFRMVGLHSIAFCLSFLFWFLLTYNVDPVQRAFEVPVEYRNLPEMWVLSEDSPQKTEVVISGPERAFANLNPKKLKISLDLARPKEGPQSLLITREHLKLPAALTVRRSDAEPLRFGVYRLHRHEVPVTVNIDEFTSPPQGYRYLRATVRPRRVTLLVRGAALKTIKEASTNLIDLSEFRTTRIVTVPLNLPADVRLAEGTQPSVSVTVFIQSEKSKAPIQKQ